MNNKIKLLELDAINIDFLVKAGLVKEETFDKIKDYVLDKKLSHLYIDENYNILYNNYDKNYIEIFGDIKIIQCIGLTDKQKELIKNTTKNI